MWMRWNDTTHIFEKSTNDGASWSILPLDASVINEGTLSLARVPVIPTIIFSTVTGVQAAFTPGLGTNSIISWAGAADVTFAGIVGGVKGYICTFRNSNSSPFNAYFSFNDAGAAAGTKILPTITTGLTPIAPGGYITFYYDGTYWLQIGHEQGPWITMPFNAANFTGSGAMLWTVAAINVGDQSYRIAGRTLFYSLNVSTSTIAGTPDSELRAAIPYQCVNTNSTPFQALDPGAGNVLSVGGPVANQRYLRFFSNLAGANWHAGVGQAIVRGLWTFPVG